MRYNGVTFRKVYVGEGYHGHYEWHGRRNGYIIEVSERQPRNSEKFIMAVIYSTLKDIRWNSLWEEDIQWTTIEEAMQYCTTWEPEGHKCLGKDALVELSS